MCLLFDEPRHLKSDSQLAVCFDPYFSVFKPTIQKILIVQSKFGWTALVLPHISPYFQPIIPLLSFIRKEFILTIKKDSGGKFHSNPAFTHAMFLTTLTDALVVLPPTHWEKHDDSDFPLRSTIPPKSAPSSKSMSTHLPLCAPQQVTTASSSAPLLIEIVPDGLVLSTFQGFIQ
ncbi:hypothetical protein OG21DRAFT_1492170 [Imleria badia]|nr:hypothetical protein OG21DRAFT_1492170 [Imleria badia]